MIVFGRQTKTLPIPRDGQWWYARIVLDKQQNFRFYLSKDNKTWVLTGDGFQAVAGEWIGARIGFYATRDRQPINDSGYLDIDWMSITPAP